MQFEIKLNLNNFQLYFKIRHVFINFNLINYFYYNQLKSTDNFHFLLNNLYYINYIKNIFLYFAD